MEAWLPKRLSVTDNSLQSYSMVLIMCWIFGYFSELDSSSGRAGTLIVRSVPLDNVIFFHLKRSSSLYKLHESKLGKSATIPRDLNYSEDLSQYKRDSPRFKESRHR